MNCQVWSGMEGYRDCHEMQMFYTPAQWLTNLGTWNAVIHISHTAYGGSSIQGFDFMSVERL